MSVKDLIILGSSSQQHTRRRNHGAYLVRWHEEGFLFDPGEGTQRQFIFANVAPTVVTRILITHFHGDHCLGLGSMLMRLNLDKVTHPIHCYYPASGKVYFDRLRYGTIYRENITVIEHPIDKEGVVHEDEQFIIEAAFVDHGVDALGYRVIEKDIRKFEKEKLHALGIKHQLMRELIEKKEVVVQGQKVLIDEVSYIKKGDIFAILMDTRECKNAYKIANQATLFLCESTYLDEDKELAKKHHHLTAKEAATIAKESDAKQLVLSHFSARYLDLKLFENEAKKVFLNTIIAEDLVVVPFPKT